MEIERKFLIKTLPGDYRSYPFHRIEQAYLCIEPVVRIRQEDDRYYLTYKGEGLMSREEYNLPLNRTAYEHLRLKADGMILTKCRYLLPLPEDPDLTIELDLFSGAYEGLILAEVEFSSEDAANRFIPPAWFGEEVTFLARYQNSHLSQAKTTAAITGQ